jgi:hypothetical protein
MAAFRSGKSNHCRSVFLVLLLFPTQNSQHVIRVAFQLSDLPRWILFTPEEPMIKHFFMLIPFFQSAKGKGLLYNDPVCF